MDELTALTALYSDTDSDFDIFDHDPLLGLEWGEPSIKPDYDLPSLGPLPMPSIVVPLRWFSGSYVGLGPRRR